VLLPVAIVQLPPKAQLVPLTVVDAGIKAAAPNTFVAAPLGSCTAPCVDVVAAGSCVAPSVPVTCVDATVTLHVDPSVQTCPLTVVPLFANAAFGIALATTATLGVVVALVTDGVSQLGHVPVARLVTPAVPLPVPAGQLVPFCKQGRIPPIVVPDANALAETVAAIDCAITGPPNEKLPAIGLNRSHPPSDKLS